MQPRKSNGQYARFSFTAKVLIIIVLATLFGAAVLASEFYVKPNLGGAKEKALTFVSDKITPVTVFAAEVESKDAAIARLKLKLIDEMAACEYPNFDQETAVPVWDDNKAGTLPAKDKMSYGQLQFKISTMQRFYKTLHNETLTNYQAILKAMDKQQARDIAIDAWINIKGSLNEWSCATDAMRARVEDIRLLMDN